jgi:Catalytic LigB subunit of aromatic ring-opening dioxygenase
MAEIVTALGTSHSPLLLAAPDAWLERADQDRTNPELYDHEGRHRTYDELVAEAGDRYAAELDPERWETRFKQCQAAIDRLGDDLAAARPDVIVVVGDDQGELFDATNQPAMALFWGDRWRTRILPVPDSPFFGAVKQGYAMDDHYDFDGAPRFARGLIERLVAAGFDMASLAATPERFGFGHAYGFVVRRLLGERAVPVVPLMLNTYYPPNQPTPERCYRLGQAIAEAVADSEDHLRVALAASGGLSHFVVNEQLDTRVLDALRTGDEASLTTLPVELLNAGSSEIRNWVTVAGAMAGRDLAWSEYAPCYRTAAGTGCGMAFARWT